MVLEISPPHQTWQQGEVGGLTTILVRQLLTELQLSPAFEVYPWARAFYIATSTPNVLIYNMARTTERETEFHWIGPVATYRLGLVRLTERTDLTPNHLKDLGSAVIAVQRDDFSYHWLKQQGMKVGKELQLSADILESWRLFLKGKVDYVIDDEAADLDGASRARIEGALRGLDRRARMTLPGWRSMISPPGYSMLWRMPPRLSLEWLP